MILYERCYEILFVWKVLIQNYFSYIEVMNDVKGFVKDLREVNYAMLQFKTTLEDIGVLSGCDIHILILLQDYKELLITSLKAY